jgi:purine-binding chemotaxis protein CheW
MSQVAPATPKNTSADIALDLLVFNLDNQLYGLPVTSVVRIIEMVSITHLPGAPDMIEGLINLQGRAVPIVDLRRRFGLPVCPYGLHTPIILVDLISTDQILGLIVDSVEYVLKVQADDLELTETVVPPQLAAQVSNQAAFLVGLAKVNHRIILVLGVDALLTPATQSQLTEVLGLSK